MTDELPRLSIEQARLLPFYHDLRNEIVQPDKIVVATQYFWTRWAPRLGPTLTVLVVCLRRHCYYNRLTQERRDWCFPEQATLAREIGVETTKTIRAALGHPLATAFVRREARYVYDPARGKKVRTSDLYHVAMDDPLTPEDEALLAVRAAERLAGEGRLAELDLPAPDAARPSAFQPTKLDNASRNALAEALPPSAQPDRPRRSNRPGGRKHLQVTTKVASPEGVFDRQGPEGRLCPQDSAVISAPEIVHEESTNTTRYDIGTVLDQFAAANGCVPTPAQRSRLIALAEQFDRFARSAPHPSTGLAWVSAAIDEAVESGSNFVAPRRIARICERWAAEGGPTERPSGFPEGRGDLEARATGEAATIMVAEAVAASPVALASRSPLVIENHFAPIPVADPEAAPESVVASGVDGLGSFVVFDDLGVRSRPLWRTICDEARPRLASAGDRQLLDGSTLLRREGSALVVGVPGQAAARRAGRRLVGPLEEIARTILGRPVEVCFESLRPEQ